MKNEKINKSAFLISNHLGQLATIFSRAQPKDPILVIMALRLFTNQNQMTTLKRMSKPAPAQ